MVILFYSWLAAKTGTSLIIISILYGIASGGFVSLQAPMITKLADDMRFAGTMVGQVLSASFLLLSPPLRILPPHYCFTSCHLPFSSSLSSLIFTHFCFPFSSSHILTVSNNLKASETSDGAGRAVSRLDKG